MASETPVLIGARYSHVEYAIADLAEVKALHERLDPPRTLDAAVVSRLFDGRVDVVETYEPEHRSGARRGLGVGLTAGALAAVLPAVGLGAAVLGAVGGSVLGAAAGGRRVLLSKQELHELGSLLARGTSGLVVVTADVPVDDVTGVLVRADQVLRRPLRQDPASPESTS